LLCTCLHMRQADTPSRWTVTSLRPVDHVYTPFNVTYRQNPNYGGLTGLRTVPPSFMRNSKKPEDTLSSSGPAPTTTPVTVSAKRPATAGSSRRKQASTSKGGNSLTSTTPYRSVSQWTSLLHGGTPGSATAAVAHLTEPSPSYVHARSRQASLDLPRSTSSQPVETAGEVKEDRRVGDDLSLWLSDADRDQDGCDARLAVEPDGGTDGIGRAPLTWRSGEPARTTPRLLRPASAGRLPKPKVPSDSPRQLNYLDGIVVQMGQPLPRTRQLV
jgi:hypothetical protein